MNSNTGKIAGRSTGWRAESSQKRTLCRTKWTEM